MIKILNTCLLFNNIIQLYIIYVISKYGKNKYNALKLPFFNLIKYFFL